MEEYVISPKIAEDLKLLNFGDSCLRGYNKDKLIVSSLWGVNFNGMVGYMSLPYSPQVLDWALEEHEIYCFIIPSYIDEKKRFSFQINGIDFSEQGYENRQKAYEACVVEVIELIKQRNESKSEGNSGPGEQEDNRHSVLQ